MGYSRWYHLSILDACTLSPRGMNWHKHHRRKIWSQEPMGMRYRIKEREMNAGRKGLVGVEELKVYRAEFVFDSTRKPLSRSSWFSELIECMMLHWKLCTSKNARNLHLRISSLAMKGRSHMHTLMSGIRPRDFPERTSCLLGWVFRENHW